MKRPEPASAPGNGPPVRLDVALFELRLYKSRSQARDAIDRGEVLLNGAPAKPSHTLSAADRVTLVGPGLRRTLEVLELPRRSLSREAARAMLREVP